MGRPVGSKKPKEASRRVWDCGRRGGRERTGLGGESLAWPGLRLCRRKGVCACAGVQVNTLLPEAETWVDPSVGGRALGWVPHREGERASEIKGNEACGFLCVCLRPCGSALEPPGTHRNAASLSSPGRPLFHKEVAARKKGGKRAEIRLAQHEPQTKANLSHLLQEGPGGGRGTKEPYSRASSMPSASRAL